MNLPLLDYLTSGQKVPEFSITVDSNDITNNISERLISMSITDNRGFEADEISIELDDTDNALVLPTRVAKLEVSLGWKGEEDRHTNIFTVDEIEHSGAPDVLSIRGRSADFCKTLNVKREFSYHNMTIEQIIQTIAERNKFECEVADDLKQIYEVDIDQTNESDSSFLTRLVTKYGALATMKQGKFIAMPIGTGKTVNGTALPVATIIRSDGDSHRFSIANREAYTGVVAYWLNLNTAKKESTTAKRKRNPDAPNKEEQKQADREQDGTFNDDEKNVMIGSEGNIKVLTKTYQSKASAYHYAKHWWAKLQRGAASFSLNLAHGRPDLFPELPIEVKGFKQEIDSTAWICTRCVH